MKKMKQFAYDVRKMQNANPGSISKPHELANNIFNQVSIVDASKNNAYWEDSGE